MLARLFSDSTQDVAMVRSQDIEARISEGLGRREGRQNLPTAILAKAKAGTTNLRRDIIVKD